MSSIKRLIREVHRRSLWQVLSIYLAGSWIALQVVETLVESAGLPDWLPAMAIALLVIGLPIVLATAFMQDGGRRGPDEQTPDPDAGPGEPAAGGGVRLFTWRNAIAGGVAAFALWGVVAAALLLSGNAPRGVASTPSSGERPVVAVLPFTSGGGEEDSKTLSLGLHDDLLTRLSKIQSLRVISRTSMMQYQETTKDIRAIGQELGAAAILEGSVLTAGNQVSINAQLIDASTDEHLWAENYQRPYTIQNLFGLQRDIAESITEALSATLLPEERSDLAETPTEDLDAYNFYLRGNNYYNNGPRSDDYTVSFQMYERAVELDPDFAEAHAKLSLAHSQYCQNRSTCFQSDTRLAVLEAASRALALAPDLLEAQIAMGYYYYAIERDFPKALEYGTQAERRGFGNAEVHHLLGAVKRRMDDFDGSIESFQEAARLDPLSVHFLEDVSNTQMRARRFDEAEDVMLRSIDMAPNERTSYGYLSELYHRLDGSDTKRARVTVLAYPDTTIGTVQGNLWWLDLVDGDFDAALPRPYTQRSTYRRALTLDLAGRSTEAAAAWDSVVVGAGSNVAEFPDNTFARLYLARAYAGLARSDDASREARTALESMPFSRDAISAIGVHFLAAEILSRAGDAEGAVELLTRILAKNTGVTVPEIMANPEFAPIRDHPAFRALIEGG